MSCTSIRRASLPLCLIGLLAFAFAALSWEAVRGKSATFDEPAHAVAGWFMLYRNDYRLSPDVPPLWEKAIALTMGSSAIHSDWASPQYVNLANMDAAHYYARDLLYKTPGIDALKLIARGRAISLLIGAMLLLLIARWGWLIGAVAAVVACACYALDPNFLGHAPLVKNDVALAMLYFACAYATWRVGQRLTFANALAIALLIACAFLTKLSGVLLGPAIVVALTYRALDGSEWVVLGKPTQRVTSRLAAAALLCVAIGIVTYILTWASYGFRYEPGPAGTHFPAYFGVMDDPAAPPAPADAASAIVVRWVQAHHLLPRAWTAGYLVSPTIDSARYAFVDGQNYLGGRWYYFPLAALYKTPVSTLVAGVAAIGYGLFRLRRFKQFEAPRRWTLVAMLVPVGVYAIAALTTDLNIGLRHVFPIYPFLFLVIGWAASRAWRAAPGSHLTIGRLAVGLLSLGLAIESGFAYPNYIAYFNFPSGGSIGGFDLLTDSNLDWGQDLPLLADWHRAHPDVPMRLLYFGLVDPAYYGLVDAPAPFTHGVMAISASHLRYLFRINPALWSRVANQTPEAVLGGTIYLYAVTPTSAARSNSVR